MMPQTVDHPGPVYIRLGKGGDPVVTDPRIPFRIGHAVTMREGADALIVSTGIMLKTALDASTALAASGLQASVLHVPTVKPFDTETFLTRARRVPVVVAIEEHSTIGGLGSAVAEVLAETDFDSPKRFRRLGIPDVFPDQYGNQASLLKRYDLTSEKLAATVLQLAQARVPA